MLLPASYRLGNSPSPPSPRRNKSRALPALVVQPGKQLSSCLPRCCSCFLGVRRLFCWVLWSHSPQQRLLDQTPFGLPDPFDSSCVSFCHILAPRPGVGFYYFIGAVMFRLCHSGASVVSPPSSSSSGCSSAGNRELLSSWSTRRAPGPGCVSEPEQPVFRCAFWNVPRIWAKG